MQVLFGKLLYGKVDEFCDEAGESVIYVKTQFWHLFRLPLLPIGSYVVEGGSEVGGDFRGARVDFSYKSCLVAWIRTALLAAVVLALYVPLAAQDHYSSRQWTYQMAYLSLLMVCFMLTALISRPSSSRLTQLTQALGDTVGPELSARVTRPPDSAAAYTAVITAATLAMATMVMTGGGSAVPSEMITAPNATNNHSVAAVPVKDPAELWMRDAQTLHDDGQYCMAGVRAQRAMDSYQRRAMPQQYKAAARLMISCLSKESKYSEALVLCKALKDADPANHEYDQLAADLDAKAKTR